MDGRNSTNVKHEEKASFKSQALLYNIDTTQERNPINKINVIKFSVRSAVTKHLRTHIDETFLSVS